MKASALVLFVILSLPGFSQKKKTPPTPVYYPGHQWERKTPIEVGLDADKLKAAIEFAIRHETQNPRSMEENHYRTFGREPFGEAIGPMKDRLLQSTTPTPVQIGYGYMNYFLNTDQKYLPAAPATAFTHIGNGTNMIYVDRENDLVAVVRWVDNNSLNEFVKLLLEARQ